MATTLTKSIVVDGSPYIIQDAPKIGFKSGIKIACFKILSTEYSAGEVQINVLGAKKILFAHVKTLAGTVLALTEGALTGNDYGISILTGNISAAADLYVYIVFYTQVEG